MALANCWLTCRAYPRQFFCWYLRALPCAWFFACTHLAATGCLQLYFEQNCAAAANLHRRASSIFACLATPAGASLPAYLHALDVLRRDDGTAAALTRHFSQRLQHHYGTRQDVTYSAGILNHPNPLLFGAAGGDACLRFMPKRRRGRNVTRTDAHGACGA